MHQTVIQFEFRDSEERSFTIVLTGKAENPETKECLNKPGNSCILEPFQLTSVQTRLEAIFKPSTSVAQHLTPIIWKKPVPFTVPIFSNTSDLDLHTSVARKTT